MYTTRPSQYTLLRPAMGVYMIGAKGGGMQVRSTRRAFGGVKFRHCYKDYKVDPFFKYRRIPPPPQPSLTAPPPPPPPQPPQQPMASQLLEHNRFLESEVNRLKSVLIAEQGAKQIEIQRNQMINNEMRNVTMQRENFSKRCNQMMNERRQLIDKQTELANKVSTLDAENRTLREEKTSGEQSVEAKNEVRK
uniref:Uncharacterized protein n=1 Tax=Caenorhabditis japonica TaxID=281687 RepID=A0A8R1I9H2_CAEJA